MSNNERNYIHAQLILINVTWCSVKSKHKTSFFFRFGLAFALVSLLRLGFELLFLLLWESGGHFMTFIGSICRQKLVNEEGARGGNLWSTCRATKTFVAGWRTAAHWVVDLLGMDPRWRHLLRDKLWVWWKKSNKAKSCRKVAPRSTFRNNLSHGKLRVVVCHISQALCPNW